MVSIADEGYDPSNEPHENEEVPMQDIEAQDESLQPETQDDDPLDAELGPDGQGDMLPEDEPEATDDTDDGPDDLRVEDPR